MAATKVKSFLKVAEKAANLVKDNVEKGKTTDVHSILKSGEIQTGKVVFEPVSIIAWKVLLIVCILCTIGFLCLIPIALGTIVYSKEYQNKGLYIMLLAVAVVIANVFICVKSIREIRFTKRYRYYKNILWFRNMEVVDDLAEMINVKQKTVEKDLRRAVKEKLIPHGHFGNENKLLLVTNEAYEKYSASSAAYDQYFSKQSADRKETSEWVKDTEDFSTQKERGIADIHDRKDAIKNKEIKNIICRTEKTVYAISHEVDINPAQAAELRQFLDYYLSSLRLLLRQYIDTDEMQLKAKELKNVRRCIKQALESVNTTFEGLFDRYYEEQNRKIDKYIGKRG